MKIILASKSGVRKKILDKYNIDTEVIASNVDEDQIKESLLAEKATPRVIGFRKKTNNVANIIVFKSIVIICNIY